MFLTVNVFGSIFDAILSYGFSADFGLMLFGIVALLALIALFFKISMPVVLAIGTGLLFILSDLEPRFFPFLIVGLMFSVWLLIKGFYKTAPF